MEKKIKVEEEDLFGVFKHPLERREWDEILNRKVSKLGNSGHISVPSKHIGKDVQVIIWKDGDTSNINTKETKQHKEDESRI